MFDLMTVAFSSKTYNFFQLLLCDPYEIFGLGLVGSGTAAYRQPQVVASWICFFRYYYRLEPTVLKMPVILHGPLSTISWSKQIISLPAEWPFKYLGYLRDEYSKFKR